MDYDEHKTLIKQVTDGDASAGEAAAKLAARPDGPDLLRRLQAHEMTGAALGKLYRDCDSDGGKLAARARELFPA